LILFVAATVCMLPPLVQAPGTGIVTGRVTRTDGSPLAGVVVTILDTRQSATTNPSGRYVLARVPLGERVLLFQLIGYAPDTMRVTVAAGGPSTADTALETRPVTLGGVLVEGVSRAPDRVIDAPAAVDVVRAFTGEPLSLTAELPLAVADVPGLTVVQSGVNDFNVNARGFNTTLSRKMLVMQDGRDLATVLVIRQTWGALSEPLEDLGRIEVIRGPGSALYGPNAFNGVISITTPAARDVVGTKLSVGAGELGSMRADLRQAGVWLQGRLGYRVNLGYSRSDDWTRSRTAKDLSDWRQEYASATATPPTSPGAERLPLIGQTTDPVSGRAHGTPDPLVTAYGSARLDYYAANGSTVTVEGGAAQEDNAVYVVGPGRNQVPRLLRPWARVAWNADRGTLAAWYTGLFLPEGQIRLSNGTKNDNTENILHLEGHRNYRFGGGAGRAVLGTSVQENILDSKGTILKATDDDRRDRYYGAFAQVEYQVGHARIIGAARWDDGNLLTPQLSPKGALVVSVAGNQTLRLSVGRAFLTPNLVSLFQAVPVGPAKNLTAIEDQLRADPAVGPALIAVAPGKLFDNSAAVPESAFGNPRLMPQTVVSYEVGYKAQLGWRAFLTVDAYRARLHDFTTGLLPAGTTGLNPTYRPWTAPPEVPEGSRATLEEAVYDSLAARDVRQAQGLTRLPNGTTAIVQSYGNAGTVDEWGVELGSTISLTRTLTFSGSYTWFDFAIRENRLRDVLAANTPGHESTMALAYTGWQGITLQLSARFVAGYHWTSGVWDGDIPARETVNLQAGCRLNSHIALYANVTNLLDQRRFEFYGGSVIGRRVLAGMTSTF
jgi:iron complex outermembrane receptor protein